MNKIAEKVLKSLAAHFALLPNSARKLLAVSGGMDSMLLLEAAHRLGEKHVLVLHVNHGLRGKESDGDEAFVKTEALAKGFEFSSLKLTWQEEKPSQASCRRRRELFFSEVRKPGERIFLAHHRDDQAETLFLRMLRGTGLDGLKGMAPISETKLRPFLDISRAEIRNLAKTWGLQWQEDSSNISSKYERNWLRNEIFPLLEARCTGFAGRLASLAQEIRETKVTSVTGDLLFSYEGMRFASRRELLELGEREIKSAFSLDRKHTASLSALLKKGSGECSAPRLRFRLSQGILLVEGQEKFSDRLAWLQEVAGLTASSALGQWKFSGLEAGDRQGLLGGVKGKKKFQEARVPLFFRDSVPVLKATGGRLLVPGKAVDGVEFTPSPLAKWWISSSALRDDPGRSALE